ncbi:hypothetical protein M0802_005479 [Mischocyttarus mexicanus]|nr:hypothetical protein M0802_005479 [Mischocyttarus mexicanus]
MRRRRREEEKKRRREEEEEEEEFTPGAVRDEITTALTDQLAPRSTSGAARTFRGSPYSRVEQKTPHQSTGEEIAHARALAGVCVAVAVAVAVGTDVKVSIIVKYFLSQRLTPPPAAVAAAVAAAVNIV